jgi:hypothetical protein
MACPPYVPAPAQDDAELFRLRDRSREIANTNGFTHTATRRALLACTLPGEGFGPDPLVQILARLGLAIRPDEKGRWRIQSTGDPTSGIILDRGEFEPLRLRLARDAKLRCELQSACADASRATRRGRDPVEPAMELRLSLAVREAQLSEV